MSILKVNTDNSITEISANKNWISTIKRDNSNNEINLLFEWYLSDNSKLLLYGNMDGYQINNHILPSNGISSIDINITNNFTLYDNIYFVKLQDNKIVNYSIQEYGEFYSINYDSDGENYCNSDSDDETIVDLVDINTNYKHNIKVDYINNLSYDNNIY